MDEFFKDPSKVSALTLMAFAILAIMKGWVVTAGHHNAVVSALQHQIDKCEAEKEEFKQIAFRGVDITDRAIRTAETVVRKK